PSRAELDTLMNFLGGEANAGGPMKEMGHCHWSIPNNGATNAYGFTALPAGIQYGDGSFVWFGFNTLIYSSTEDNAINTWSRRLFNYNTVCSEHTDTKAQGLSVRCVKDICSSSDTVEVTIVPSENPVCEGDTVTFTATPVNGGSHPGYQWFVNDSLVSGGNPNPDSLMAWYPFTGNTNDISGNNNHGIPENGVTLTTDRFNNPDNAYEFNGTDGYIATPHNATLVPSTQITEVAWVYPNTTSGSQYIIYKHTNASVTLTWKGYSIRVFNGKLHFVFGNQPVPYQSNGTINPNEWTFIALTYDGISYALYINGILDATGTAPHDFSNTDSLYISRHIQPGGYFDGKIDDVRLYSRALTEAEILSLYENTGPTYWYVPVNGDTVSCVLTSSDTCVTNNPDTSNLIIMQVETCTYCPGIPTVDYEGKTYNTVLIGTQCWLKENLDVGVMINGNLDQTDNEIIEKYCYNNEPDSCIIYGGLYQWDEIMEYTTMEGIQGICPPGWIIPTDNDWCILENFVDAGTVPCTTFGYRGTDAGGNLKEAGTTHWNPPNLGATNSSDFTALPAGHLPSSGTFNSNRYEIFFWTSSVFGNPLVRSLYYELSTIRRANDFPNVGYSLRCLKDTCTSYLPISVSIVVSNDTVCVGDSVTFTATPVNGGSAPEYQWKVNGINQVTNNPVFEYEPVNGDQVTCVLTSDIACPSGNPATSNQITITVNPPPNTNGIWHN
ncbi:MAG: hypothetical protein HQ542_08180, partial [Bacteroidia bacterium]|nr:hypothetical protein [Bacteroidia bacterium]